MPQPPSIPREIHVEVTRPLPPGQPMTDEQLLAWIRMAKHVLEARAARAAAEKERN